MKTSGLAMAVMAVTACGGSSNINSNGQATCSVTLSGAQTGTYDCQAALGSYTSSDNKSGFGSGTNGAPSITFSFIMTGDLHTGTFKDTDAGAIGIVSAGTASNQFWAAEVGQSNSDPKRGSYTANLTSTGNRLAGTGGAAYVGLKGTVTAVLEPIPGSGATGNVNLTATFQ